MSDIDTISMGDTLGIAFDWSVPDATNPDVLVDITPIDATAEFLHVRTRTSIDISSYAVEISGNETSFVLPTEATALAGLYCLYLTAVFTDGSTITKSRLVQVNPKDGRH